MITLEYLNQLKHLGNQYQETGSEGALLDLLEALLPALPPMVGGVVSEFLRTNTEPNTNINTSGEQL